MQDVVQNPHQGIPTHTESDALDNRSLYMLQPLTT